MKYNWRKRRFGNMFILNFLTLSFKLVDFPALFKIYFHERVFKIKKQRKITFSFSAMEYSL